MKTPSQEVVKRPRSPAGRERRLGVMKTPSQELLELQRHLPIKDILLTTLEQYRGRRNSNVMVAADLGVSVQTLANWCKEYEIDIHSYRLVTR